MQFQKILTNGVTLNVAQAGDPNGELVVLLHGFPEFWYGWRRQMTALAEAGYWVWAPDQRGYNDSEKPNGVGAYRIEILAADILGLLNYAGYEERPCTLVGHDWGGAVAWWLAAQYPQRFRKIVILNTPHQVAFGQALSQSESQRQKSGYMFFFQQPERPEILLAADDYQKIIEMMRGMAITETAFTDEDILEYKKAWSKPDALTSMLNWYRAMFSAKPLDSPQIKVPTLIIWGKKDTVLGYELAQASLAFCENGRLETLDEATHWLHHERPEQVNRLLLDFLAT